MHFTATHLNFISADLIVRNKIRKNSSSDKRGGFFLRNRIFRRRVKIFRHTKGEILMKILLINGSPHANGNTAIALNEMIKVFQAEGVETNLVHVGGKDIRGCTACGNCFNLGKCVFDDAVNETAPLFE